MSGCLANQSHFIAHNVDDTPSVRGQAAPRITRAPGAGAAGAAGGSGPSTPPQNLRFEGVFVEEQKKMELGTRNLKLRFKVSNRRRIPRRSEPHCKGSAPPLRSLRPSGEFGMEPYPFPWFHMMKQLLCVCGLTSLR